MSSNSSAPESVAALIEEALAVLDQQSPCHADLLPRALGSTPASLQIDDEQIVLRAVDARLRLRPGRAEHGVRARLSLPTLVALVDQRLPVAEALRRGQLAVWGSLHELGRASRACEVLVHGLVRAADGPRLLLRLRELHRSRGTT